MDAPHRTPAHHTFERALRAVRFARSLWLVALLVTAAVLTFEITVAVVYVSPHLSEVREWSFEPAFGPAEAARNGAALALFVATGWFLARRFRRSLERSRERLARATALSSRSALYRGSCGALQSSPERALAAHAGHATTRLAATVAVSQLLLALGIPPVALSSQQSWALHASFAGNAALMALAAFVVLVRAVPTRARMFG